MFSISHSFYSQLFLAVKNDFMKTFLNFCELWSFDSLLRYENLSNSFNCLTFKFIKVTSAFLLIFCITVFSKLILILLNFLFLTPFPFPSGTCLLRACLSSPCTRRTLALSVMSWRLNWRPTCTYCSCIRWTLRPQRINTGEICIVLKSQYFSWMVNFCVNIGLM